MLKIRLPSFAPTENTRCVVPELDLVVAILTVLQELLERYSPLHDLTEEERIRVTARRVGLDTPIKYKP
jgi:hypothetical protein